VGLTLLTSHVLHLKTLVSEVTPLSPHFEPLPAAVRPLLLVSLILQPPFRPVCRSLYLASVSQVPLSLTRREAPNCTCACWLPEGSGGDRGGDKERQLLGTVDGEILLVEVRLGGSG